MKHQLSEDSTRMIAQLVSRLAPESPATAAGIIERHLAALLEANKTTNLTAIREEPDAVRLHVEDSLLFATRISQLLGPDSNAADLGSGGGLPAIPLAAVLGMPFTLAESVGKKCRFLQEFLEGEDELAGCSVACCRAEELAENQAKAFDLITARALTALPSLVELAAPLLKQGGHLAALKANPDSEERERGLAAARMCGLSMTEVLYSELSGGETRTLLVFRKVSEPKVKLPRRPGMAQRKPLV